MHVVVTGGAGFIGSHIVEYHLDKGDHVHAIDDLSTGLKQNLTKFKNNPRFRFTAADILIWPDLEKAISWADRVYHMAAVVGVFKVLAEPIKVLATNIAGCERLLRAITAGGWQPKVIIASSSEVYGPYQDKPLREDSVLTIKSASEGHWNYAVSKLADEVFSLAYYKKKKTSVIIARLFNTIGPRQTGRYGMVVPRFVQQAVAGEPLTVFGDGKQTRCFCDVRDTVRMLDLLCDSKGARGQIVNVGNDYEITIQDLAKLVKKLASSKSPIKYEPYEEAYGEIYEDTQRRVPDLKKLKKLIDFKHNWSLDKSLENLIRNAK